MAVDGDEAVRGEDGIPERVLLGVVCRAVPCVPPDGLVDGGGLLGFSWEGCLSVGTCPVRQRLKGSTHRMRREWMSVSMGPAR